VTVTSAADKGRLACKAAPQPGPCVLLRAIVVPKRAERLHSGLKGESTGEGGKKRKRVRSGGRTKRRKVIMEKKQKRYGGGEESPKEFEVKIRHDDKGNANTLTR
jgi:hypothetical protein